MPTNAAAPCAVIQGPDEKAKGEVLISDLIAGAAPSDIKERDEYLKKQAEAQFAVKEDELVEEVRKLLSVTNSHNAATSRGASLRCDPAHCQADLGDTMKSHRSPRDHYRYAGRSLSVRTG